jgi:hypothetical protein
VDSVTFERKLKAEIRQFYRDKTTHLTIDELLKFVNNFEDNYQNLYDAIVKEMQTNEYFQSPCEDCWYGCSAVDKIWYCKANT